MVPRAISFAGCGFLGIYHAGALKCLQDHGSAILNSLTHFGGASAGSLAAAVLSTCPEKISQCQELVYKLAEEGRRLGVFSPKFVLREHVRKMCDDVLPIDAHKLANNRLYISITHRRCHKNKIIFQYKSRDDLIEALVSSCHIPYFSGREFPFFRGEQCYDGGFTNNLITFENMATLYVTPFSGGSHLGYISPKDLSNRFSITVHNMNYHINARNVRRLRDAFFPPTHEELDKYFDQGYEAMYKYLEKDELEDVNLLMKKETGDEIDTS